MQTTRLRQYARLLMIACLPLFALGVFLATVRIVNLFHIEQRALSSASRGILIKIRELGERAFDFDQTAALRSLGMNADNGTYFRFDENMEMARFTETPARTRAPSGLATDVRFEFSHRDSLQIKPHNGQFSVENGVLAYAHNDSNFLENTRELSIPPESVGEIEIRLKVARARKVIVAWSSHTDSDRFDPFKTNYLTVWTIPDDRFHTYRLDAAPFFKAVMDSSRQIRKLFLFPFQVSHDRVEIDYLRFISKIQKYIQIPCGTAYERKAQELRSTLYMLTNSRLSYDISIPSGKSFLDFGIGSLEPRQAVTFDVLLEADGLHELLFSRTISDNGQWHDSSVDLSKYVGLDATVSFVTSGQGTNVAFWSDPILHTEPANRLNFLVIVEDALRADHLSCYGDNGRMTPVKEELAARGVLFKNAYSQSTETWSSCASFMTSLYPSATGVWDGSDVLNTNYVTLAEVMRSQGYATASFLQNILAGPPTGLQQGFDAVIDHETIGKRADRAYGSPKLREWLESNSKRNFFIYLHILDPHGPYGPYDPPPEFIARIEDAFSEGVQPVKKDDLFDPLWLLAPSLESRNYFYSEEVRFNDSQLPLLFGMLEALGLAENTVIIFIADHGEHLGEHDLWGHRAPGYRQVVQVPFIVAFPKRLPCGKIVTRPVQLLDLMPTVLDMAGVDQRGLLLAGESLLPLILESEADNTDDRIAVSEEVRYVKRDDPRGYGSIFWRNTHILCSRSIDDAFAKCFRNISSSVGTTLLPTRSFDLVHDREEVRIAGRVVIDLWFQRWASKFFERLKSHNLKIWNSLTRQSESVIERDQRALDELRVLGYVE